MSGRQNTDLVSAADLLAAAAAVASQAPSIHNTQPWHWQVATRTADLYLDSDRQLSVTDPDRRMAALSCGAALHHAEVVLAAAGAAVELQLLPQPGNPLHLARLTVTGVASVTAETQRLREAIDVRHTDRRPLRDQSVQPTVIPRLQEIAAHHLSGLYPLDRGKVLELAAIVARAQAKQVSDIAARQELAAWTGTDRRSGLGIPDANIPMRATATSVPSRDFGHVGTLPVNDLNDEAATYAILFGHADDLRAWLRGGQALSDIWLNLTDMGVAMLPLSAAVETLDSRELVNRVLAGVGYGLIAARIGVADPTQGDAPRTPRLRATDTVTRADHGPIPHGSDRGADV